MNIETQAKSFNENLNNAKGNSLKGAIKSAVNYSENQTEMEMAAGNSAAPSFKAELEEFLKGGLNPETLSGDNIQDILDDMDIGASINLDTLKIEKCDALFFLNTLNEAGYTNYAVSSDGSITDTVNYKSIEVSKTLSDLLLKAKDTKSAVRLDFDNNVTVILKLTDGKINAQFIPGDKAVEEYLRNNIPYLKQRFDEQNIPYANLSYKQQQQGKGQQNKEKK